MRVCSYLGRTSEARRRARPSAAFTLVEGLLAAALALVVILVLWRVFGFFFGASGKTGVTRLTGKSLIQREMRVGLKKFLHRLREASELLDPPGRSVEVLRFKDILNNEVRLRLDAANRRLVSERNMSGTWVLEKKPEPVTTSDGRTIFPIYPVRIDDCERVCFTISSPTCVIAYLTLTHGTVKDTVMLAVDLQNSAIRK